ncbi:MAG: hypothetical protein ABWY48_02230 [Pseudoxanthomonas sp.]
MKPYSPEPLTQEERELALLTGHLGPHGEPSSALDAKILAAAHAALERKQPSRRKPRWPVAMGLAASVILAVGIAWQLRPLQQLSMAPEAPAVERKEAVADSAAMVRGAAEPLPEAEAPVQSVQIEEQAAASTAAVPSQQPAPPPSEKRPATPAPASAKPTRAVAAPNQATEPVKRRAQIPGNTGAFAPPAPPAPPAPIVMSPQAVAPAPEAAPSFAPDPSEGYSTRAAAADSSVAGSGVAASKSQADALAETKAARANTSARQKEADTLDRIEVTGSRMKRTDLQVPVSDDAQLPVNEWLERVRTRYGLGDAGAAKQSLLLFVKDHPSEPVPGDLEPLLEE